MENTIETTQVDNSRKKRGFWNWCLACLRWFVIGILAIALGQFLYLVFTVDMSFGYVWYAFWAVLGIECFLIFSTTKLRQSLVRNFFRFLVGAGKGSVVLVRWIFILLFAVILLGGLYFKAPWKILVLDAVLLALLTIVPKRKRKYGWLTLVAAVLVVTVWIFIPEKDTGDWRPYTFDEEVAALNAKYGVPEDENAAPYYEQIELTDFYEGQVWEDHLNDNSKKRGPALWDPNDETLSRPWTADEFPELATWLETEKEKIAPFWKAVEYDRCWFEVQADPNAVFKAAERNGNIKKAAMVIHRMAYKDLGGNDILKAVDKFLGVLQCSNHLQQQASLLDSLVCWAIYSASTAKVRELVVYYDLDEKSLNALEQKIKLFEKNWDRFSNRFLDYEEIHSKNLMGLLFEVNDQGKVRFTREPDPLMKSFSLITMWRFGGNDKEPSMYWQERENKLDRFIRWLTYSQSPEELFEITDEINVRVRERIVNEEFDYAGPEKWQDIFKYNLTLKSLMELYIEAQIPVFGKIQNLYNRTDTYKRGSLIVVALKRYCNRHGHWPETLDEIKDQLTDDILTDPMNGLEFIYKLPQNGDTFILYGCGWDGIDDKGFRSYSWSESEKRKDDILIWPRSEDELKQMLGIEESKELDEETIKTMMPGMF